MRRPRPPKTAKRTDMRRPSLRTFVLALACAPLAASAAEGDTLYKCVDAAGLTTIQNAPCPKGQTQAWARPTAPEPPPTPEQLAAQQAQREQADRAAAERAARAKEAAKRAAEADAMQQEVDEAARQQADAAARRAGVVDATPPPVPNEGQAILDEKAAKEKRCSDAKDFALSLRSKPWLGLDDAQWQRLYGWVVQECR